MNNNSDNICHVCQFTASNADEMYLHIKRKQCVPSIVTTSTHAESSFMAQMDHQNDHQMDQTDQMDQVMEEADMIDDIDMNELNLDEGKHLKSIGES